jgi:hypothetical protein
MWQAISHFMLLVRVYPASGGTTNSNMVIGTTNSNMGSGDQQQHGNTGLCVDKKSAI